MSRAGVDQAVDRIRGDQALAERVVGEGGSALASFDLSDQERTAITDALKRDVEERGGEVSGFASPSAINWGDLQLNNVIDVGRSYGGGISGDVTASGHEQWIELDS